MMHEEKEYPSSVVISGHKALDRGNGETRRFGAGCFQSDLAVHLGIS